MLNKAMACGVPVIAADRGSARTLAGDRAGLVVRGEEKFVAEAARQVEAWIDAPQDYFAASQAAIEQADILLREAVRQLDEVAARICSPETAV